MSRRAVVLAAAAAAMLGAWATALFLVPLAPLWIGVGFAAVCLALMVLSHTTAARAVWFNVAFIVVAAGAFDAYVGQKAAVVEDKQQIFSNPEELFLVDDILGVRPKPGVSSSAKGFIRGKRIYDVVYSIDESGLRISPPAAPDTQDCVLFFGDSYTFGEGVEDDETMPYRTGVHAGGRYRVRNFGFFGYGPHQMLAAIESGFVEHTAGCRPRYAVFQTEYHHVVRAAGIWTWDQHGPRYALAADGRPVRDGNFDSQAASADVLRALEKSAVAAELRKRSMEAGVSDATEDDIKLYRAIVEESRRRLESIWPDIEFHVIFWDSYESQGRWPLFEEGSSKDHLNIHQISNILPATDDPEKDYKLGDKVHPNAHAHDLIARYVARKILRIPGE